MRSRAELLDVEQRTLEAAGLAPTSRPLGSDPGNHDYREFLVKLKLNGGVAGDLATPCSFTYDLWRIETPNAVIGAPTQQQITNFRLATAKAPVDRYLRNAMHVAAATGTEGRAYYNFASGALVLLKALDEHLDPGGCS